MLYKHLPPDKIVISRRTKLRTMSNSMSIEYEDIKPTQSTDCVLETETQDNFPEIQETVCNYDIFYSDDPTSDDDDPCDMAECTGCIASCISRSPGVNHGCVPPAGTTQSANSSTLLYDTFDG